MLNNLQMILENSKVEATSESLPIVNTVLVAGSCYLPYSVETTMGTLVSLNNVCFSAANYTTEQKNGNSFNGLLENMRLILRPISDLSKFYDDICWGLHGSRNPSNYRFAKFTVDLVINQGVEFSTDFGFVEWMFKNHFDVFGLIEKGLAIDINTLSGDAS